MQTKIENKMQTPSDEKEVVKVDNLIEFNFPDYGIVIKATSLEEAQQKLLEIIKKNK